MDSYDLSHKLAYAGRRSPVPFFTGPEYLNSVPGVPVLSMLRIFVPPELWSEENVKLVSKEICRVLGATAQFDIGITLAGTKKYDADRPASGDTARLLKMDANSPQVILRLRGGPSGDRAFEARYPRLLFTEAPGDTWREQYAPGAVKEAAQP